MEIKLIDYTPNAVNKVSRLARSTREVMLEREPRWDYFGNANDEAMKWSKKNSDFIKQLIKVKHLGTLEHVNFTFHISGVSRCLTHQLVRHRIASYLQMSNRHARPYDEGFLIPETIKNCDMKDTYREHMDNSYELYNKLIEEGVPVEDARYVLPPAYFTHISITINARALRHLLELRLDKSAQWEIRELACKLFDAVHEIYPIFFEDLEELRKNAERKKPTIQT